MAEHRRASSITNGGEYLTETDYRAFIDMMDDAQCYESPRTAKIMEGIDSAFGRAPVAFINGIIVPETRGFIGQKTYSGSRFGDVRPLGTVPSQYMNETVKGIQKLGDRVCDVDKESHAAVLASCFTTVLGSNEAVDNLFNKYPAGVQLTKAEIDAWKKNKLRPCIRFSVETGGNIRNVQFSNGILCTGYIQLLDDALQQFKSYIPTLIGKPFTATDFPFTIYPRRIVHDRSRLVKSCFNPVINEAAQIALECEVIAPDGSKIGTKFIWLSNPSSVVCALAIGDTSNVKDFYNYVTYVTMINVIAQSYKDGRKDLTALLFIMCCFFFKEDLEAQVK